uniref:Secreted protein n=1 Tax=Anopheles darlingi TaxID=43151 RepID=A0A2M4DN42_ANODA
MLWNCCLRLFFVAISGFSCFIACSGSVCSIVSLHSKSRSGFDSHSSAAIESSGLIPNTLGLGFLSLCITDESQAAIDRRWLLFFI